MSLSIEDGFNFYLGQQIGEMVVGLIGLAAIAVIGGIIYLGICICDWWSDRKLRKNR